MADRKRRTARVTAALLAAAIMLAVLLGVFSAWRGQCRQGNEAAGNDIASAAGFALHGQADAGLRAHRQPKFSKGRNTHGLILRIENKVVG